MVTTVGLIQTMYEIFGINWLEQILHNDYEGYTRHYIEQTHIFLILHCMSVETDELMKPGIRKMLLIPK